MSAHDHDTAPSHSTLRGYLTGFLLSVILTAIPFGLVMGDVLPSATATGLIVMAFAIAQILVHMVYFLHMDFKVEGGWSMLALLFTLILVLIALTGSLWVMHHLNRNMMPGMMEPPAEQLDTGGTEGMPGFGIDGLSGDEGTHGDSPQQDGGHQQGASPVH